VDVFGLQWPLTILNCQANREKIGCAFPHLHASWRLPSPALRGPYAGRVFGTGAICFGPRYLWSSPSQQTIEGFFWLRLEHKALSGRSAELPEGFLLLALVYWPIYATLATLLTQFQQRWRSRRQTCTSGLAEVISLVRVKNAIRGGG
jgi:hypothetical protein